MTYMWILKKEPPIRPGTPDPHKPKYSQTIKSLVVFSVACYLTFLQNIIVAVAAEGGYSNYIPGFYGDLALATELPTEFSIRNDVYYYSADTSRSARSGQVELNAELTQTFNFLTFLHKPGIEFFGGQYAYDIWGQSKNAECPFTFVISPLAYFVQGHIMIVYRSYCDNSESLLLVY